MKKRISVLFLALCLVVAFAAPAFAETSSVEVERIIEPQYEDAGTFGDDGLAAVKQNGKWGYVNEAGVMVISPQFDWAGEFNEGVAAVAKIESVNMYGEEYADAYVFYLLKKDGSTTALKTSLEPYDEGYVPITTHSARLSTTRPPLIRLPPCGIALTALSL